MGKVLKVGIIGTGWISHQHITGYIQSGKAEIIAVSDINEDAAKSVIQKYGLSCNYYKDYRDLLANGEVEAVSICAPNRYHSEITVAAANAGKHIMAEKPFVSSPEEAIRSYRAIRDNGIKCAVGYHRRFNPLYQEMKRLLRQRRSWKTVFRPVRLHPQFLRHAHHLLGIEKRVQSVRVSRGRRALRRYHTVSHER